MKIKHYLITAVVAYLTFLVSLAPAAPIFNLLIKDNNNIAVSSINGTLWAGDAGSIRINNKYELIDAQWNFNAWRLLTGEISFEIGASYKQNPITTTIGLSITGKRLLHNLTTSISAFDAGKLGDIPIGELDGAFDVQIDEAVWAPGAVPEITGNILWKSAAYIVAERAELGDLTITIGEDDPSPLTAVIENTGGHLKVDGEIAVNDEGHYTLVVSMKPTRAASNNLRNSLKMFAKSLPDGNFEINYAGELSTLGFM